MNNLLKTIGIIFIINSVLSYDLSDFSFSSNEKSWIKFGIGLFILTIYYILLK